MRPYKYCVVDLSGGPDAAAYPVTYLKTEPPGWTKGRGWSDEYKTSKLVLRRMERGQFLMGVADDSDESRNRCIAFDKPFYIGVLEVTQRQYELVTGKNPSQNKGAMRPVENVSWSDVRGWWKSYNWPSNSDVNAGTFLGRLRARTGLRFDLPSEAQWEYACRAGTTSGYNNGGNAESDLKELGRYADNQNDGRGGYSSNHTIVGSYSPNTWGGGVRHAW